MTRVLYVADLRPHTRASQRLVALRRLGHEVTAVSIEHTGPGIPLERRPGPWERLRFWLGRPLDPNGANDVLLAELDAAEHNILWVEKGLTLRPATLARARRRQPHLRLVLYSEDDLFAHHNQSAYLRAALPAYDVVFTHKSYNANPEELPALGARRVYYHPKSFDPELHRPIETTSAERERFGAPVTFIGTFEQDRAHWLAWLAGRETGVRVWGNGWCAWRDRHPLLRVEDRPIYGEDYVRSVCASDIQLGFLRKKNRDLHTDRSIEVPACGAFLLAERSSEHLALFEEGREAEYFDTREELLHKLRYFLAHPAERRERALAARARCLASGYSHDRFLERALAQLEEAA